MPKATGKCYENSCRFILSKTDDAGGQIKLAHGFVTGTGGQVKGVRYGHAWIEISNTICLDFTTSLSDPKYAFKRDFYELGQIDPAEVKLYTLNGVRQKVTEFGTYGPWDSTPKPKVSSRPAAKWVDCAGADDYHDMRDYCSSCAPWWATLPVCPVDGQRLPHSGWCKKCRKYYDVKNSRP